MISVHLSLIHFSKTPVGYHYANHPAKSVDRIREVVFDYFDISTCSSMIFSYYLSTDILLTSRCRIAWERRSSCYGVSAFISSLGTLSRLEWKKHTRHYPHSYTFQFRPRPNCLSSRHSRLNIPYIIHSWTSAPQSLPSTTILNQSREPSHLEHLLMFKMNYVWYI